MKTKLSIILITLCLSACGTPGTVNAPTPVPTFTPITIPELDGEIINVDSCGANPWDNIPDSTAIQTCIDQADSGDIVTFSPGRGQPHYIGYIIDHTLYLVNRRIKHDLLFTSSDPQEPASLIASEDLKGFVVRLIARSTVPYLGSGTIDNVIISNLIINGGRDIRSCYGPDETPNGLDDNWGSWLDDNWNEGEDLECNPKDSWCTAGSLAMDGRVHTENPLDYRDNPDEWSTGLQVINMTIVDTECGTALGFGGASGVIRDTTILTAGEHVHLDTCTPTDPDESVGGWADGITLIGPGHLITGNTIINPSDIGIVSFGGRDTVISNNIIKATAGNYGMFDGIAIHPFNFGDISDIQIINNTVINEASSACGGIHVGINIGTHMVKPNGCLNKADPSAVGNSNICSPNPPAPEGALCNGGQPCQTWAHVASGKTLTLEGNYVSGAQINYLIEGLDLMGEFIDEGNTSDPPRMTDWECAKNGWEWDGVTDAWGVFDRVAFHPTIDGWTEQRVHCTR